MNQWIQFKSKNTILTNKYIMNQWIQYELVNTILTYEFYCLWYLYFCLHKPTVPFNLIYDEWKDCIHEG